MDTAVLLPAIGAPPFKNFPALRSRAWGEAPSILCADQRVRRVGRRRQCIALHAPICGDFRQTSVLSVSCIVPFEFWEANSIFADANRFRFTTRAPLCTRVGCAPPLPYTLAARATRTRADVRLFLASRGQRLMFPVPRPHLASRFAVNPDESRFAL